MLVFPRLPNLTSRELAAELGNLSITEARDRSDVRHPQVTYSPTGGVRAPVELIREIQLGVRNIGEEAGLLAEHQTQEGMLEFDRRVAALLHARMTIPAGDAAHVGVWQFLTCVVVPDVVRARFPGKEGTSYRRFVGGPRNVLGRLWWRAHVFAGRDGKPTEFLSQLGEDELVQIMERPEVAGHRHLVQEIARQLLRRDAAGDLPPNRMHVMRDVMKRVRRLLPIISFEALDDLDLAGLVAQLYEKSLAVGATTPASGQASRGSGGGLLVRFLRRHRGRDQ